MTPIKVSLVPLGVINVTGAFTECEGLGGPSPAGGPWGEMALAPRMTGLTPDQVWVFINSLGETFGMKIKMNTTHALLG